MSKHTPGPWRVTEMCGQATSPRDGYFVSLVDSLGVRSDIATVRRCPTINAGEVAANARLIAAAPELYEALKELVSTIDALGTQGGNKMERARAAIAKAEGRS